MENPWPTKDRPPLLQCKLINFKGVSVERRCSRPITRLWLTLSRRSRIQYPPRLCWRPGVSIAVESNDELQQLRTRLRKMSDDELVRFGKAARSLCRDPRCPDKFKRQRHVRSGGEGIHPRVELPEGLFLRHIHGRRAN
jgi:hypothetical protein